jgi:hypothetical protein
VTELERRKKDQQKDNLVQIVQYHLSFDQPAPRQNSTRVDMQALLNKFFPVSNAEQFKNCKDKIEEKRLYLDLMNEIEKLHQKIELLIDRYTQENNDQKFMTASIRSIQISESIAAAKKLYNLEEVA